MIEALISRGATTPTSMTTVNIQDEPKHQGKEMVRRTPRQRRTLVMVFGLVVIAALGAFLAVVLLRDRRQEASAPAGLQRFDNLSRNHTYDPVTYEQSPRSAEITTLSARAYGHCRYTSCDDEQYRLEGRMIGRYVRKRIKEVLAMTFSS
jgi:hypothetical protein